ncbi:hypothetical protein F4810DRAFT_107328 [Camillea tinctor]|nr:hypothetical protein F4810DRAFT_107328 [Camillea tinctor]
MSSRITSTRTKQLRKLVERIERTGYLNDMPCGFCLDNNLKCVVSGSVRSRKCSECVRRARVCEGVPLDALSRLERHEDKLSTDELRAEGSYLEKQQELNRLRDEAREAASRVQQAEAEVSEALSRLFRLRRQRDLMKEKGLRLVASGLESMDELEELERLEREHGAAEALQSDPAVEAFLSSLDVAQLDQSIFRNDAVLGDPGFADETQQVPVPGPSGS